jgi:hypothetical protein
MPEIMLEMDIMADKNLFKGESMDIYYRIALEEGPDFTVAEYKEFKDKWDNYWEEELLYRWRRLMMGQQRYGKHAYRDYDKEAWRVHKREEDADLDNYNFLHWLQRQEASHVR